ncbi:MAG: DUF4321 domain-containing protein [Elusimicrobiales bacterium]
MRNAIYFLVIILVGALLGNFFGKMIVMWFPQGNIHDLFATEIATGLHPTNLDLVIVNLTFGCLFKFNITGIAGILAAAMLSRLIVKK